MRLSEPEQFMVLRRRAGLRQSVVASAVGVTQPMLSQWESGARELDERVVAALWLLVEKTEAVA